MKQYILSRLRESSTIRNGIRLIVITIGFFGYHLNPEIESNILVIALSISSIIGIIFPDNLNKSSINEIHNNETKNNNEIITNINKKTDKMLPKSNTTKQIDNGKKSKNTRVEEGKSLSGFNNK